MLWIALKERQYPMRLANHSFDVSRAAGRGIKADSAARQPAAIEMPFKQSRRVWQAAAVVNAAGRREDRLRH